MSMFNDRVFGVLMIVLAVAYGWGATQFPEPFGGAEAVGPETFPYLLAVVLGLSSLYMVVRPDPDNAWPWSRTGVELIIALVVLVLYAALLQPLGFILATLLLNPHIHRTLTPEASASTNSATLALPRTANSIDFLPFVNTKFSRKVKKTGANGRLVKKGTNYSVNVSVWLDKS